MNNTRLQRIRESERQSHIETYTNEALYQEGSWLRKPIKTVLDILPLFEKYKELTVLDLGCGVGRNCLSIAEYFREIPCRVECVDILELAIEKLEENAGKQGVAEAIKGIMAPIEDYPIKADKYDLILAVSALEHIDTRESFEKKLAEISRGIRKGGVVCLVMNSEVTEQDKITGKALEPQFEVNLPTEEVQSLLQENFAGWEVLKETVRGQQYDIPRECGLSELRTNVVTFVGRKGIDKAYKGSYIRNF